MKLIRQLVNRHLKEHQGDPKQWSRACEAAVAEINGDILEYMEPLQPAIRELVWGHIRQASRKQRSYAWKTMRSIPAETTKKGLESLARATLYDYVMPGLGGLTLGESTRTEVLQAAAVHREQASANSAKAAWFEAIAQRLKHPRSKVRNSLSEEDLRMLGTDFDAAA